MAQSSLTDVGAACAVKVAVVTVDADSIAVAVICGGPACGAGGDVRKLISIRERLEIEGLQNVISRDRCETYTGRGGKVELACSL